ncbi:hypothetical protein AVEN_155595-1 [Araneus ventricosus]|uniref:Uncharacterized protein n=1 Tax=Araneus ventricosus TaxID=182803 RepID=A0A4Y2BXA2_ARAVE|nr:hypothetical protein AVEN_155595-1 [Araneus ventricosus]
MCGFSALHNRCVRELQIRAAKTVTICGSYWNTLPTPHTSHQVIFFSSEEAPWSSAYQNQQVQQAILAWFRNLALISAMPVSIRWCTDITNASMVVISWYGVYIEVLVPYYVYLLNRGNRFSLKRLVTFFFGLPS